MRKIRGGGGGGTPRYMTAEKKWTRSRDAIYPNGSFRKGCFRGGVKFHREIFWTIKIFKEG